MIIPKMDFSLLDEMIKSTGTQFNKPAAGPAKSHKPSMRKGAKTGLQPYINPLFYGQMQPSSLLSNPYSSFSSPISKLNAADSLSTAVVGNQNTFHSS
jgi:hypothetical protein